MVLVYSSNANHSPQIKREVERAINKGLPVVPFRVEDVAPSATLEYFISETHWLDAFTPPLEHHLERLADAVKRLLASKFVQPSVARSEDRPARRPGSPTRRGRRCNDGPRRRSERDRAATTTAESPKPPPKPPLPEPQARRRPPAPRLLLRLPRTGPSSSPRRRRSCCCSPSAAAFSPSRTRCSRRRRTSRRAPSPPATATAPAKARRRTTARR